MSNPSPNQAISVFLVFYPILFQCYAPRCLDIFPSLTSDQRKTLFCTHLEEAQKAVDTENYARKIKIKLKKLKQILELDDFKIVEENAINGKVEVAILPQDIFVVPSFSPPSHNNPIEYIHIRNNKCPLESCKEKRSKLHSLVKKDAPLCIHTMLTALASNQNPSTPQPSLARSTSVSASASSSSHLPTRTLSAPASSSNTKSKIRYPKLNRDLTIQVVIHEIVKHFPSLTQLDKTTFVSDSRKFIEELISNNERNATIREHTRYSCTACNNSTLEEWQFQPKHAFLLRNTFQIYK